MSEHTPGPWEIEGLTIYKLEHGGYWANGKAIQRNRFTIWVGGYSTTPKEEILANVRLIAAAPELLEALKAIVALSDRKTDAWDRAHAAIAKAEGKL